jgi:myo-inositol 2-dehydrogenase / D-chiro-inositol 1-dehydrogenase
MKSTRRTFLKHSAAASAAFSLPFSLGCAAALAQEAQQPRRERRRGNLPTVAAIGVGGSRAAYAQGTSIAMKARYRGRMIAVCDVDQVHCDEFNAKFDKKLKTYIDYRELLETERPDIVTIGTPDHWHVPIAIAALRAGCDVYCEKPLTLTIAEGALIRDAVRETGRVFQVGTQQRSEHDILFLQALALVKSGRLGKNVNADIAIGGAPDGGPFPNTPVPEGLNWDLWLGPTQAADYSKERFKEFRWYYDYSGGKMTDWGAHHIDIAQWALGHGKTGPMKISLVGPTKFTPLVPDDFNWNAYFDGKASLPNGYHTATEFHVRLDYADGSYIAIHNEYVSEDGKTKFPNGILFTGDDGRIFVNRERLTGKPIEDLTTDERGELYQAIIPLYKNKFPGDHMRNFFECVKDRSEPISDVETHVCTMNSCHLANIALMLGRTLEWDPTSERFPHDDQAQALTTRPRREAYSLAATT